MSYSPSIVYSCHTARPASLRGPLAGFLAEAAFDARGRVAQPGAIDVTTNGSGMKDAEIAQHIEELVAEEHALLARGEAGEMAPAEHQRLAAVNVQLDRYYDLLRQRRARRDAGQDPENAEMRAADTVEHYLQ